MELECMNVELIKILFTSSLLLPGDDHRSLFHRVRRGHAVVPDHDGDGKDLLVGRPLWHLPGQWLVRNLGTDKY